MPFNNNTLLTSQTHTPSPHFSPTHFLPFYAHRTQDGTFSVAVEGTMEGVLGYISSWSAVDKLRKNEGEKAATDYLDGAKKRYAW